MKIPVYLQIDSDQYEGGVPEAQRIADILNGWHLNGLEVSEVEGTDIGASILLLTKQDRISNEDDDTCNMLAEMIHSFSRHLVGYRILVFRMQLLDGPPVDKELN